VSGSEVLDQHLAQAERALDAAAGSSSLCTISRSGTPMPGIKYPEGAWVALRDVRRLLQASGDLASSISEVRQRWQVDLDHHANAESGQNWISYLTGGLDALDDLATATAD
jgi:hypothetical protein